MTTIFSQSPRLYLERTGIRETLRAPASRLRTDNPILRYPVSYPLPRASISHGEAGSPPPDRLETTIWPHGGPPTP